VTILVATPCVDVCRSGVMTGRDIGDVRVM